jgi:hypothetical protein
MTLRRAKYPRKNLSHPGGGGGSFGKVLFLPEKSIKKAAGHILYPRRPPL